jgi:rRNA maturation endonuclease Nob1
MLNLTYMQHKFKTLDVKTLQDATMDVLYCVECEYTHPVNAGLDEGDLCPDCGQGILVKI